MDKSGSKKENEFTAVTRLIAIYCKENHKSDPICGECFELLEYAKKRLELCPYDPKPKCKECKTHCYNAAHRDKIRQVMKFSGMHMVKHGRLDLMFSYFLKDKLKKLVGIKS